MIWKLLKHMKESDSWIDPSSTNPILLFLLESLMNNLPHGTMMKLHKGQRNGADFHIIGIDFLTAESLMIHYLLRTEMMDHIGFGIYPDWYDPGFHLDVRGHRSLWGQIGGNRVLYEEALTYAREKFKNV